MCVFEQKHIARCQRRCNLFQGFPYIEKNPNISVSQCGSDQGNYQILGIKNAAYFNFRFMNNKHSRENTPRKHV